MRGPQLGAPPSLEQVPLDRLQVDPTYQRATDSPASKLLINGMVKAWDWTLCQPIVVSRRADGTLWVLDGQHRVAGAKARGDIPFLPCVLLSSLDHQAEAKTFVGLNTRRQRLTQGQIFHGQLAAGDPTARLVQDMLDQASWRVRRISNTASFAPGDLECAPMLVKAVHGKSQHHVRFALNTLRAAYPDVPVRPSATLLKALFELFDYVGDGEGDLTAASIIAALGKHMPEEWVMAGHVLRERNAHLSHIDACAAAMRSVAQGKPLPQAGAPRPQPAITVTHQAPAAPPPRQPAVPPRPIKAPPETGPVFGTSGKGWCDQCETLRTRDQAKACTDPFCKLRPAN
ncbi:UNVERIFIED_ORG: hypothetical protein M2348_001101 [Sphingomonas sp. R1F5B]